MKSGKYERSREMQSGKIPEHKDSHKAILEILTDKEKSTEQVRKELLDIYRINYCSRTVREHIKDLLTLGWIKRVVKGSDMRVRHYQRKEQ